MALIKHVAAGSQVLTQQVWNKQMNDVGSEFNITHGIQTSSDTYAYDTRGNIISGNHTSATGSWYEWYVYDSSDNLVSGNLARNGFTTITSYKYDANNNISGAVTVVN
jgi:YD repeat-containing protein